MLPLQTAREVGRRTYYTGSHGSGTWGLAPGGLEQWHVSTKPSPFASLQSSGSSEVNDRAGIGFGAVIALGKVEEVCQVKPVGFSVTRINPTHLYRVNLPQTSRQLEMMLLQ